MVVLVAGYVFYGRWLAKKWGIDEKAKTPAFTHEDGEDFVPSSKFTVFSHQFSSIAGAGPVTGPILSIRIRMGSGTLVADHRRSVLRCRTGFRCAVCLREERRKIHGNDH
ncbi:MAG: carbon starvation CstA family protein [Waltera sp.]